LRTDVSWQAKSHTLKIGNFELTNFRNAKYLLGYWQTNSILE
jgi:hypothetical protein